MRAESTTGETRGDPHSARFSSGAILKKEKDSPEGFMAESFLNYRLA